MYETTSSQSPSLIMWFFDSRSGLFSDGSATTPSTSVPDYVDPSVGPWITSELKLMNRVWGPDSNRQAIAFVHIPPHAIQIVFETLNNKTNPGLNDDELGEGSTQASATSTIAGKDGVWWNTLTSEVKNLRAIVSGHGSCFRQGYEQSH